MDYKRAAQHACAWAIHYLYTTNQEALNIINDEKLSEQEKIVSLRGPHGADHRLANLLVLFKPLLEIAQQDYPDQQQLFEWFKEKWKFLEDNNMIKKPCGCLGCKTE